MSIGGRINRRENLRSKIVSKADENRENISLKNVSLDKTKGLKQKALVVKEQSPKGLQPKLKMPKNKMSKDILHGNDERKTIRLNIIRSSEKLESYTGEIKKQVKVRLPKNIKPKGKLSSKQIHVDVNKSNESKHHKKIIVSKKKERVGLRSKTRGITDEIVASVSQPKSRSFKKGFSNLETEKIASVSKTKKKPNANEVSNDDPVIVWKKQINVSGLVGTPDIRNRKSLIIVAESPTSQKDLVIEKVAARSRKSAWKEPVGINDETEKLDHSSSEIVTERRKSTGKIPYVKENDDADENIVKTSTITPFINQSVSGIRKRKSVVEINENIASSNGDKLTRAKAKTSPEVTSYRKMSSDEEVADYTPTIQSRTTLSALQSTESPLTIISQSSTYKRPHQTLSTDNEPLEKKSRIDSSVSASSIRNNASGGAGDCDDEVLLELTALKQKVKANLEQTKRELIKRRLATCGESTTTARGRFCVGRPKLGRCSPLSQHQKTDSVTGTVDGSEQSAVTVTSSVTELSSETCSLTNVDTSVVTTAEVTVHDQSKGDSSLNRDEGRGQRWERCTML